MARGREHDTPEPKRRKVDKATKLLEKKREDATERQQQKITDILARQDARVRLLFHLEKFVSLVNYDPEVAKEDRSQVFEEYRQQYDLWSKVTDESNTGGRGTGRRSTRRQIRQQQETAGVEAPVATPKKEEPTATTSATVHASHRVSNNATKKSGNTKRKGKRKRHEEEYEEESDDGEKVPVGTEIESSGVETIAHPSHVEPEPEHGGLENFLDSFILLDDVVTEQERDEYIAETVATLERIEDGKQRGILTENSGKEEPTEPKFKDPLPMPSGGTFQQNLMGQALNFSKLMSEERKSHISQARKMARDVEHYFKRLESAEKMLKKEEEKRKRQFAKWKAQEVMKKWKLAEKVVQQRRARALEEEQREQGMARMNEMLENSVKLLESRIPFEDEVDEEEADGNTDLESGDDADSDDEEDENMDSDELSDSDDEDDEEPSAVDGDDSGLTVEQLREKYAALENMRLSEDEESERETTVTPVTEVEVKGDDDEEDEEDLSDESIEMDSEAEESELDDDASDEGEEDEEPNTLASLFGPKPSKASVENDEAENGSAVENVEDDVEMADHENGDAAAEVSALVENGDARVKEERREVKFESDDEVKDIEATKESGDEQLEVVKRAPSEDNDTTHSKGKTEVPFLLRGTLREYQHYGLDWLAGLYNSGTNGILADEMGLGKTIQTISLISYLACEKHIWGPHLIVVPTSVMLNWEMEFKRFAPGFKVMTYYGNPQQRKEKRRGWNKEDVWHVCITSYQLVLQDQNAFKRKKWHYLILDEAHNIKNFRSQRWQALLNFNSERRLLLTGTPLQNNLVELWSLLYFLMPSSQGTVMMPAGFANLKDFQEWFARPVDKMVEEGGSLQGDNEAVETVTKLHQILRPYLLRRLKADVEKQMPAKTEHIYWCRLSKRQRYLYDDFMSRAQTRETLASGNYLSIINCLMQLRKVCNHPDLFEVRPIVTSMACNRSVASKFTVEDLLFRKRLMENRAEQEVNFSVLGLDLTSQEHLSTHEAASGLRFTAHGAMLSELRDLRQEVSEDKPDKDFSTLHGHQEYMEWLNKSLDEQRLEQLVYVNRFRAVKRPIYGRNVLSLVNVHKKPRAKQFSTIDWNRCNKRMSELVLGYDAREEQMRDVIEKYAFVTPNVVCLDGAALALGDDVPQALESRRMDSSLFHHSQVKLSIAFPDKRLLQYDCGKLQRMAELLRNLVDEGHRALIFTQMTKVLDILEQFLNIHGYRYLRLDGATKIEERQVLTERFNNDPKIPVFILSTRSGGLGINLTGADTVIFYDSDWNPSMDKQCQDRCHRIGQTRDVNIYRFVSEHTIESNILQKATQKLMLDNVVIQEGDFTTDYLNRLSVRDMLGDDATGVLSSGVDKVLDEKMLAGAEEDNDAMAARLAKKESNLDQEEFDVGANTSAGTTRATTAEPQQPDEANGDQSEGTNGRQQVEADAEEEEDDDDEIGDVTEYMIRFIERGDFYS